MDQGDDDDEDVYDAGDGHEGFVVVGVTARNWMRKRRLLADFLIEVGRLSEGNNAAGFFQVWLADQGAPSS